MQVHNEGKLATSRLDWKLEDLLSVTRKWRGFFSRKIVWGDLVSGWLFSRVSVGFLLTQISTVKHWAGQPQVRLLAVCMVCQVCQAWLGCVMFFLCKNGIYRFISCSFRILPLMPQKKKAKRPKREHGDAERKMKGRKNLKMIVSVVVMEASWSCVTGNLVLKLIISLALAWWNVLLVSQPMP